MAAAHALLWRRHRWTALRSLLLVALLHRLHCLAFLAASSPVWLLAAFLLGVVLVHSEPNVPLAAASEDEDRHLTATGGSSSGDNDSSDDGSSATSMEDVGEKEEEVVKAAVAWTADDERSIQSIGSLELERDARLEKLMSRRSIHRNLIDLDIHIPAVLIKNPFDLHHHHHDDPGSAPSALLGQHSNPFDFDVHQRDPEILRRHESFTAGAAPPARPSRFRPYFVADVSAGGGGDAGSDNSNSSSSPSSSAASDQKAHQQAAVKVEEEEEKAAATAAAASPSPPKWGGNGMVVAVDVELISDSSDDDMSLPGDDAAGSLNNPRDEDEEDSFEVESITQQVAAGACSSSSSGSTCCRCNTATDANNQTYGCAGERQQQQPRDVNVMPGQEEEGASISVSSCSKEWVAPTTLASPAVEESEKREIREHHIMGPVPVTDDDASTATAAAVVAAAAPPPAAAAAVPPPAAAAPAPSRAPSVKPSSKSKATSKKAVFGFFRK
ncbi:uncharacterized protein LOC112874948 isoform X1 [Panicum hallii]|jgi:hypothetical protein|uniref:uncharacterized protein LOC112874948 isoform X1 n=1 Tax=Panicum hallii TaxID=206008 RepID=UPI000DF4EDF7|nr:uncharacterized protein LOC112874948 isoform X1 [Panicum hallii]XP_025794355.1 uncharacterized protein LOC112874948 isoform X1 [Panicum hallii]